MSEEFVLNEENYYSSEANWKYCSASQFKNFFGSWGCEARAIAELKGEYVPEKNTALLVGQFVDTAITEPENMQKFINEHPEMFSSRGSTKGMLKSEFQRANQMIETLKGQDTLMKYLSGEHQKIYTGELFGVPFKIKMDSYLPNKAIVDLKTTESIRKPQYDPEIGKCTFIEAYGYIWQGALYQEIVYQNTGQKLPFFIVAVSKEPKTDFELIWIDDETLHNCLYGDGEFSFGVADKVERLRMLKKGEAKPVGCGTCDYCLSKKKVTKAIHYTELLGEINR